MKFEIDKTIDDYLTFSNERARAFLDSPPRMFMLTKTVDALLREVMVGELVNAAPVPSFLAMNAYYSFLAATRMAAVGHVSSIFPLVRTGLESACYGFLISDDDALMSAWINRDRSEADRSICRSALTSSIKKAAAQLTSIQMEVATYLEGLYDASITYGAHPNPQSVFRHLQPQEDDGSAFWRLNFTCMYDETSYEVQHALLTCAEYGIMIAYLNMWTVKSHVNVEVLNRRFNEVNDLKNSMAEELRSGFEHSHPK